MSYADKAIDEKKLWYYKECPKCKQKLHIDRKYCACLTDLRVGDHYEIEAAAPPKMYGKVNIDWPNYTCEVCGAKCSYCASHGCRIKNIEGFGGLDCGHRSNELKCTCCRLIIKNSDLYPVKKALEESFKAIQKILERRVSA